MKNYEKLIISIKYFEIEDVITASIPDGEENFIDGTEIFSVN